MKTAFVYSLLLSLPSAQCFAYGSPPPRPAPPYDATASGSSKSDTQLYGGFAWVFGAKSVFEVMIGIRSLHVDSSGKVSGADVSTSTALNGPESVKLKAKYVNGTTNGQGEIGVGYAFGPGKFLGTAGYALPYFSIGTDYLIGIGLQPFASANTVGKSSKPSPTYSCTGVPAILIGTRCEP